MKINRHITGGVIVTIEGDIREMVEFSETINKMNLVCYTRQADFSKEDREHMEKLYAMFAILPQSTIVTTIEENENIRKMMEDRVLDYMKEATDWKSAKNVTEELDLKQEDVAELLKELTAKKMLNETFSSTKGKRTAWYIIKRKWSPEKEACSEEDPCT